MAKLVSKAYGDALFSLATEEEKLDTIWNEVTTIRDSFVDNPEFIETLCHPEMTQEKRLSVLDEIFKLLWQDISMKISREYSEELYEGYMNIYYKTKDINLHAF